MQHHLGTNLYERLAFAGIRVVAASQGVDTFNPQAELLIGVHRLIDAVYWRELAQKTHRGMEGLALRDAHRRQMFWLSLREGRRWQRAS